MLASLIPWNGLKMAEFLVHVHMPALREVGIGNEEFYGDVLLVLVIVLSARMLCTCYDFYNEGQHSMTTSSRHTTHPSTRPPPPPPP